MVAIGLIYLFSALWTLIDVFKAPILFSNHIFGLETRPTIVKSFWQTVWVSKPLLCRM